MTNYKLKQKNDLIQIFKNGQFKEFEKAYTAFQNEFKEFLKLYEYFSDTYYPEFKYPGIDFTFLTIRQFESLCDADRIEKLLEAKNRGIIVIPKKGIFQDKKYPRFKKLAERYIGKINPRRKRTYMSQDLDKAGKLFAEKYLIRDFNSVTYVTLIEDAIKFGEPDIINFIINHPLSKFIKSQLIIKRFTKKLADIRKKHELTYQELADSMGISEQEIKEIEKLGYRINNKIIDKYAAMEGISVDQLLEFDCLRNAYYGDQDYFKALTGIVIHPRKEFKIKDTPFEA